MKSKFYLFIYLFSFQDKTPTNKKQKETLIEMISTSDKIMSVINKLEVLANLGAKSDKKDVAGNKKYVLLRHSATHFHSFKVHNLIII